jgi:hypothetical protein
MAIHNRSNVLFALTVTSLSIMVAGDVLSSVAQRIIFNYSLAKSAFHILLCFNDASHSEIAMNMY